MIRLTDAMGREVRLERAAHRVVSLVPSETETVVMLGARARLVGRTDYCVEPRGEIEGVPTVGGTKDARDADVIALGPDLVLVNQEENTPQIVRALEAAGAATHVSFPKTVEDAARLVRDIAVMRGIDAERSEAIAAMDAELEALRARRAAVAPVRVFCPIWMEPLMTIHGETFLSDALDLAGAFNVFCDRRRRYPLAADVGPPPSRPAKISRGAPRGGGCAADPWSGSEEESSTIERRGVGGGLGPPPSRPAAAGNGARDTRYPRVTLDEVRARAPRLIVLPDEPHPFDADDAAIFASVEGARVLFVSGRDLSWYSPRMGRGIRAIADVIDAHR